MCASYGLGGGLGEFGLTFDLPPMHEPESREVIAEWIRSSGGTARITGRRARNLNPIIHEGFGERRVDPAWWWLHVGADPAPFSAFNSRDDRLLRSWRDAFQRRAILPASWYVEKGVRFALPGDEPFGIAAIVSPVAPAAGRPEEPPLLSYSMVTRAAVGRAVETHPRMPMLLPRESYAAWLDPGRPGDAELLAASVRASEGLGAAVVVREATGPAAGGSDAATLF